MDAVANMITHIKNAGHAGRQNVVVSYSNLKADIAKVLKEEGFIQDFRKEGKGTKSYLSLDLILDGRIPKVKGVKRISKSSKRVYRKATDLRPVRQGYGLAVVSTPKGVMAAHKARKANLGGELLFSIW